MKRQEIKIYSPNHLYKQGILNIFKGMIENILNSRELIWRLFLRDVSARYKQSLLGWAWIFLMPVITMGTFLLLNISGIIRIGQIPVPYPIFGLLGFSLWQALSNGWAVLTVSVTSASSLVRDINFPKETLIFSSIGQIIVDFLIRLVLVLIVYLLYGLTPSFWILLFPLYVLPIFLLTLGLGFLTSLMNVIVRDTLSFINVGMNFFLFLMPIMYTMPEKGFLAQINKYNPVFFLINTPRDLIISGSIKYPTEFFISLLITVIIFLIGWFIFYISQSKIAERM
jgi:lipopolysaccharide transport system permease protein